MEKTKKRLRATLEVMGMTKVEKSLFRILDMKRIRYTPSWDLAQRRRIHAERTIYDICRDKLMANDIDDIMEMVELYASGQREAFFAIGFMLGIRKEKPRIFERIRKEKSPSN